jgi:molybdopterin-guanine dinucleotide biosynthesis protein
MAVIVIGGQSRSVGKTGVVAGLIAALTEFRLTAFKITQYGHGICSRNGSACDCATADHAWAISEENNRSGNSDTSRFLQAGAHRVWWVRSEQGRLAEAMPSIRRKLEDAESAIFESNSIVKFIRPDLYLSVLDPSNADFKKSAQEFLDRADAVILHRKESEPDMLLKAANGKPIFYIDPPRYLTAEVIEFVREKLAAAIVK